MQVLLTTLLVIFTCAGLYVRGKLGNEETREYYFNATLALTYLTLPTTTTMIFGVLTPCDWVSEDEGYQRRDYSIRCDDQQLLWFLFGIFMVLLFPVGVTSTYAYLLLKNKAKIMRSISEREKDHKLMAIGFLFDPYLPEFWYWEIVETVRRLLMTGVLSIIKPGTYTQLSAGLIFAFVHTLYLGISKPYAETRDNAIAILGGCQLFFVFLSSCFLKFRREGELRQI